MSPRPAAPSSASAQAWATTSASLWPTRPGSPSNTTPPSTSTRSGASEKACTSKPCPTRTVMGATYPRVRSRAVATARSSGPVILMLVASPGTTTTPAAGGLDQRGVVGGVGAAGVGRPQDGRPGRPAASAPRPATERSRVSATTIRPHGPATVDPLDGVAHPQPRDGGVGTGVHRGDHGLVQLGRRERPGGVVHDDRPRPRRRSRPARRAPNRRARRHPSTATSAAPLSTSASPSASLAGREHHDHVVGGGAGRGEGAVDHPLAVEHLVLLGPAP